MAFVEIVGSENRLKRSQDISSGVWQVLSGTVKTANVVAGPDGTISGGKLAFGGATNSGLMQAGNGAMVSGKDYTYSIWVKGVVGGETIKLLLSDGISASLSSVLTATTKWKRYSVTKTSAGTNAGSVQIRNATTDTGKEVYIWGGQLEESKTASSYKKTTINVVTPSAGSDGVWEFEDSATVSNTYPDSADGADTTVAGGVRTYNKPGDENGGQELSYLRARRVKDTNYQLYSQNLGHSSWTKRGNCTVTANAGAAPDGTNTSNLVSNVSGSAGGGTYSDIFKLVSSGDNTSGVAYEASFWIKRISGTATNLIFTNPQNGAQGTWGIAYQSLTIGEWTHIHSKHPLVTITNAYTSSGSGKLGSNFKIDNSLSHNATFEVWGILINKGTSVGKYSKAEATVSFIERGEVSKTYYDNQ